MATEDHAATCIQAGFRGFRWRKKQCRGVRAVTKLQALQRGRFTRREFAQLRDFSREQENYQQATRRRQLRIWRNEQELYFLQHTNAANLERVRVFQQQHSARLIQRCWRAVNHSTASRGAKEEDVTPSDRIYTFDPFGLASVDAEAQTVRFSQWSRGSECANPSQLSPSLALNERELSASGSTRDFVTAIANEDAFASRRRMIQERIKRKAAQEKVKADAALHASKSSIRYDTREVSNRGMNRRRELYEQVVAMKCATAQRVFRYEREIRATRQGRDLFSAQLVASCENRIKHLQVESPEQMIPLKEDNQQVYDEMETWGPARCIRAWEHHRRAVRSVLEKRYWWQTQLAGDERDIRQVVMAKSPWEDENKIWCWPSGESSNQNVHGATRIDDDSPHCSSSNSVWPSVEIERFLVGDKNLEDMEKQRIKPVSDDEASEWWRAHCTQSHLAINGALMIEKPYSAEFSNNVSDEGDVLPVCTSEVVANRDLYKLQQRAKRAARTKSLEQDIEQRIKNLTAQVERRVHEMEVQVEANTQLALKIVHRKEEQRARITREQQSAMTIQRYARGMQGRKYAREVRAEFFVMVRGRAIRRGRCEECGDQRAVLECQQCEESLHFCPICWVHVHSTRRRKTHVAIPMTTVVAPILVQEVASTKALTLKEQTTDSIKGKFVNDEGSFDPSLRALPSPPKQSTTRSAEPAAVKVKKPVVGSKVQSSQQGRTVSSNVVDACKSTTPELVEACALARRVRAEVKEVSSTADNIEFVPGQKRNTNRATDRVQIQPPEDVSPQENSANDEVDFSNGDGDNAQMMKAGILSEEQQGYVEAPGSKQPLTSEPVSLLSESISSEGNHGLHSTGSVLTAISSVAKAITESMEQEAESTAELSADVDAASIDATNCSEITEASLGEANGDTENSVRPKIAGATPVLADRPIPNDTTINSPPSNDALRLPETEQVSEVGVTAEQPGTTPEDAQPTRRSTDEPPQQDS